MTLTLNTKNRLRNHLPGCDNGAPSSDFIIAKFFMLKSEMWTYAKHHHQLMRE